MTLVPVFLVTPSDELEPTTCTFRCGFCRRDHIHGLPASHDVERRTAHCWKSQSPLKDVSYGITLDRNAVNAAMLELWEEILLLRERLEGRHNP